jgi:hypothetical protein
MPTTDQVKAWRALRGRFLNALWDAEAAGASFPRVSVLLETTGDRDLPHDDVERLVRTLHNGGLIDGISFAEGEAQQIRLTSGGRAEVEQWLAEPTRPTEHLPLPANQVFNIDSMHVTGTVVQGSAANMIVTNVGVTGEALQRLVADSENCSLRWSCRRMSERNSKPILVWSRTKQRHLNQGHSVCARRSGVSPSRSPLACSRA